MSGLLHDSLEYWARQMPDEPAIIFGDRTLSYREVRGRSAAIADHLEQAGLKPGQVVGITGVNSIGWCLAALGTLWAGGVLAAYNHRFVTRELAALVDNSEPRFILSDVGHRDRMQELHELGFEFEDMSLEDLEQLGPAEATRPDSVSVRGPGVRPDAPALIVYTSGSTGTPKGVVFTHQTVHATVLESVLMEGHIGTGSKRLGVMPMATAAGIFYNLLHQIIRGGALVLEEEFQADRAFDAVVKHRIAWVSGPPIVFERLSEASGFADADLSCIRSAIVGGARVSPQLLKAWQEKGVQIRQLYGSTEAGGVATVATREEALAKPDSCGRGGIFTDVRVVRPDGAECDPGEPGELVVRGPGCTPGYWRNQEATDQLIRDGWLHSGDLGIRDEEGCIIFVDRIKDMIISGGLNISPREIEETILTYPGVSEVAVFPVADKKFGETPAAVVRAASDVDRSELVGYCRAQLADFKVPRYIEVIPDELPRLPSGKLDKRGLRASYAWLADSDRRVR